VTSSSTPPQAKPTEGRTQLAAHGLVANAARKDMQLGLGSLYLEAAEQQRSLDIDETRHRR
jgi:hypothetical protein